MTQESIASFLTHQASSQTRYSVLSLASLALAIGCLGSLQAKSPSGDAQGSSIEAQAAMAEVRIKENIVEAQQLMAQGDEAVKQKDYEAAYVFYLDAIEKLPSGGEANRVRSQAVAKFSRTAISYAEWLVSQGRYSEAEQVAKTVLLPQFDPAYKPAVQFLSKLEQNDYFNKTVTPAFAAQRDQVGTLLQQAEGYAATGRFDLATRRYEEVLNIDPYNSAARKGMEVVDNQRGNYYQNAYNETRSRMLWEVSQAWETPVRRFDRSQITTDSYAQDMRGTELIQAKLNRIILPSIDLVDAPLQDAVAFLKQQSERLDPGTDGGERGVNIVLKQSAMVGTPSEDGTGFSEGPQTISLSLKNVPLAVALDYLAQLSGRRVKLEPFAVSLVPLSEPIDAMITKDYRVPPGFIPPAAPTDNVGTGFSAGGTALTAGPALGGRTNTRQFLEGVGVTFPAGASANYVPAGSKLVVTNTLDNIDIIDRLVAAAVGVPPTQVNIESKFIEVSQNNLDELGFDWLLGPFNIGGGVYGAGGDGRIVDPGGYPFQESGGPVGGLEMTRGLRTGSGIGPRSAVSVNSVDALLTSALGAVGPAPAFFGVSGIFTNPQFQVLIRALSQKKGVDLMTAPTVTTVSGQAATIRVARKFFYPTEFDPPQIPQSTASSDSPSPIFESESAIPPTITPSHPTGWTERDIGVVMEVTPIVGADSYTIDLSLTPSVTDFDGFINYGSPINAVGFARPPELGGLISVPFAQQLTENVINQPIFSARKVTTNVTIWDGQTLALGGLMREDVQQVRDKVPILGDIPIAGRLFRSNVDQKIKKNLIIFVTAKLVDAEGQLVRRGEEEEDQVDLLGLPQDLPRPNFSVPHKK